MRMSYDATMTHSQTEVSQSTSNPRTSSFDGFQTLSFLRKKRQRCVQLFGGGLETVSLFIDG